MKTTIRVMLNRDRVSKSGYYALVIRIIHHRRKKLIYSSFKLRPEEFNEESERVLWIPTSIHSKRRVGEINGYILALKKEIDKLVIALRKELDEEFSIDDIMARFRSRSRERYLFRYIDHEIGAKNRSGRHGSANILSSCRNSLLRFTSNRMTTFKHINYRFVNDYIDHLRGRDVSNNTIHMYLRNLRAIYNKARKEGVFTTKASPFEDVKMSGTTTMKRAVSKDVLRRIAHLDLSMDANLEQARDMFLFSFYTRGMSMVDILNLKHSNIMDGYIYYVRNKTGQNFKIGMVPALRILIDKYRGESKYVFPYLNDNDTETNYQQYRKALCVINIHLKKIGKMAQIDTPLTTYVARHSWATIAKSEGIPIFAISEGLGHTTEKTTQIYLRELDNSTIDDINRRIVNL